MFLILYIRTPLATTAVQASTICLHEVQNYSHAQKSKSRLRNVHEGYVLYRALVIHTTEEAGAAEGRSVWGGSQVPTSQFITMSYIYTP